jgi:hypothetical protein
MSENVEIEELTEGLKLYINTNVELIKLELTERSSMIGAGLISNMLLGLACALFVLFISLGAGFYLSALLGNNYSGFAIIAGFYLLLVLILMIGQKKLIERPLRDKIIRKVLTKSGE